MVMFESTLSPQDALLADEAPDPAVLRAERRLRLLEELAEIGMELARALKPGAAPAATDDKAKGRDPADAFGPLSRAIRLTLALEAKTDQELRDLKAGIVKEREAEGMRRETKQKPASDSRRFTPTKEFIQTLRQRVFEVIDAEAESEEVFVQLCEALDERLEDEATYANWEYVPLQDAVWILCKALGVNTNWRPWINGSWIHDRPPDRRRDSALHRPGPQPNGHDLE